MRAPVTLVLVALVVAFAAECTVLGAGGPPCDVGADCSPGDACVNGFCTRGAGPAGEGEGDAAEGEGNAAEGEGEGNRGPGEGEGEGEGNAGEGEGEGEGEGQPLSTSCAALHAASPAAPSGSYDIQTPSGVVNVFCEMTQHGGGWTRALLDDFAAGAACPAPWVRLGGISACARPGSVSSSSVTFPVPIAYTEVLGSIQGLAFANLDAFQPSGNTVDANYVDGVSVTTTVPRAHLFTLAASHVNTNNDCPCDGGPGPNGFVGDRFVCDRATNGGAFDTVNPLWDDSMRCFTAGVVDRFFQSAPLATATGAALEVRLLIDQSTSDEDIALTHVELYVR